MSIGLVGAISRFIELRFEISYHIDDSRFVNIAQRDLVSYHYYSIKENDLLL